LAARCASVAAQRFGNTKDRNSNLYGEGEAVDERHRHRYEVNPDLIERIEAEGLVFVGKDESGSAL